jgi:hypothetical protein
LTVIIEGIPKAAAVLSVLMKLYTIPCHDRGHINVMLVLQSCTDPLEVMAGSSADTLPTPSDGTYSVGNIKVEQDIDMKVEEEEVNVKTENIMFSDEEECVDVKDEFIIHSEEKQEKAEDIDTKEEEDIDRNEEVS